MFIETKNKEINNNNWAGDELEDTTINDNKSAINQPMMVATSKNTFLNDSDIAKGSKIET